MAFKSIFHPAGKTAWFCAAAWAWLWWLASPAAGLPGQIPEVVGQKLPAAQKILRQDGYKVKTTAQATFFPGEHLKVFRQYPRPGSPPGGWNGVVEIWYYDQELGRKTKAQKSAKPNTGKPREQGLGPSKKVSVPMLRDLFLNEAEETLRKAGLLLTIEGSVLTSNRKLLLKVADQNPPAGTLVPRNSQVLIYLFRLRDYRTPQEIRKSLKKREKKETKEP